MQYKDKVIIKNSIFLFSRTLLISIISLYTVREVLNIIGAESYGLFNLIFGIVTLFTFVNGALLTSTQRYLGYKLGEKDEGGVRDIFFSSLIINFILGIFLSCVAFFFEKIFLEKLLNIDGMILEAKILYRFAILSIFISIIQTPFLAVIVTYERMKVFAYLGIIEAIAKLLIVYILYSVSYDKLITYGFLNFVVLLVVLFAHIFYVMINFRRILHLCNFSILRCKFYLKEMLGFMGWNLFGNLALVGKTQGVNIVLNLFFGVLVNAAYAISISISAVFNKIISSFVNAINPQIYKSYAENNEERTLNLILKGAKYSYFCILILIIPVLIFTKSFLGLWLKVVPNHAVVFTKLSLILLLIDSLSITVITGLQAVGNIKKYQIVVSFFVLLNLPFSFLLLKFLPKPEMVFYIAIFISFICLNLRLTFLEKSGVIKVSDYYKIVINPILSVTLIAVLFVVIFFPFMGDFSISIFSFVFLLMTECLVAISIFTLGLDREEKQYLTKKLKGLVK